MSDRSRQEGELSKFIEKAVTWCVFHPTLGEARAKFADLSPDDLQWLIDELTANVRTETPPPA